MWYIDSVLVDFYFAQKTFFPKNLLPNSGCGLSTGAAYIRLNTVSIKLNISYLRKWPIFSEIFSIL